MPFRIVYSIYIRICSKNEIQNQMNSFKTILLLATLLAAISLVQCGGGAKGAGEGAKSRNKNANTELAEPAAQAELSVAVAAVGNASLAAQLQEQEDKKSNGTGGRAITDEQYAAELQAEENKKTTGKRKIVPVLRESSTSEVIRIILIIFKKLSLFC
jgi:hypothetical protein